MLFVIGFKGIFTNHWHDRWRAAAEAYYDIRYLELLNLAELHFRVQGDQTKAAYYAQLANL